MTRYTDEARKQAPGRNDETLAAKPQPTPTRQPTKPTTANLKHRQQNKHHQNQPDQANHHSRPLQTPTGNPTSSNQRPQMPPTARANQPRAPPDSTSHPWFPT